MSKKNDWKSRQGVVYSTNTEFIYTHQPSEEVNTLPAAKQNLRATLDKNGRAGKQVTLIVGFIGSSTDLESLTRLLKSKCGVGGSCQDGEILIQGDVRDKVVAILAKAGYKTKNV